MCLKLVLQFCIVLLLNLGFWSSISAQNFDFEVPESEYGCMKHFKRKATGVDPINTFILAKMSELMYLERMDYQLRYLQNCQYPIDTLVSSASLRECLMVNDQNFEIAFKNRFEHYFKDTPTYNDIASLDENAVEWKTEELLSLSEDKIQFKFIHKTAITAHRFMGFKQKNGYDPELMVVSTPDLILIIFRGTDSMGEETWGEWAGTDFRINLDRAGGSLHGTKIHEGFWNSFDLIRDDLIRTLDRMEAKGKSIWISGHSLGGAMSIVAGAYLKSIGFSVEGVYSFAGPRVVGNQKFAKKLEKILPNQVQRFEYYLDPITMLWAPRYQHVGQRNWFDAAEKGNYCMYQNVKERYINFLPFQFRRHPFKDKRTKEQMRQKRECLNGWIPAVPYRFYYHNPQFYVKAAYAQLSAEEKAQMPAIDDSFPFLYDSVRGPMDGTK